MAPTEVPKETGYLGLSSNLKEIAEKVRKAEAEKE
jgi:hypothetical protein